MIETNGNILLVGDCLEQLRALPDESVQCCVSSPPYWGLRDYGVDGQLGLEKTPEEYTAKMVAVFREVRRVLRLDGTLWLNLGDSYYNYRPGAEAQPKQTIAKTDGAVVKESGKRGLKQPGLKEKDLVGIPWRVAFALQQDGWWLRSDIIWSKPNPMPESVQDRPTKAHEYIFLLTKSAKYTYYADAVREPYTESSIKRYDSDFNGGTIPSAQATKNPCAKAQGRIEPNENGRNARSVWTITTKPYREAHFATFPPELVERCLLAGTKEGDVVLDPFAGSGTTGFRAQEMGRKWIMIELNPEYVRLIEKRTAQQMLL